MKRFFYGMSVVTMVLGMVACGDSVSSSSEENDDKESSSSVVSEVSSSSSVKPGSSSSAPESHSSSSSSIQSDSESSSSGEKVDPESSSSEVSSSSEEESSSSVNSSSSIESSSSVDNSSSSFAPANSSSSSAMDDESSSSSGLFDMAKDEFLNPKISYGEMTDTRDNKTYKTVMIGGKEWMAENLNYADFTVSPVLKDKSWCYDDKAENCDVTGRLYTWAAAIDSVALANDTKNPQTCGHREACMLPTVVRGVCPDGWHLPTFGEWETLIKAVGGTESWSAVNKQSSTAGKILKSGNGWYNDGDGTDANGTDNYGFSAIPAGNRSGKNGFESAGSVAHFWSASPSWEGGDIYASHVRLASYTDYAKLTDINRIDGLSVRCVRN